jgi:NAD(P)-dependent dehydrogenase (short-subunit alcohol dehydrogenase family)
LKGVLFTVQKALPLMSGGGSIIIAGSTTSIAGTPAFSVYSATKAAIRNFVRSWILNLRGKNIRVNVLSPGAARTTGLLGLAPENQQEAFLDSFAKDIPLGRVGDPDDVAMVAVFWPRMTVHR